MSNLLEKLNEEQKQAVTHKDGPLMIVAGAGTGKTTVITKRIAWLIEQKLAQPDEILALTFTEKASTEMEERVDVLLPYGYVDLWILTFHSFCEKILRENALEIGLSPDFKLLDETQQWIFIKKNLDKFDLDYYRPLGNPTKFINAMLKHFSRAKDEVISTEDYLNYAEDLRLDNDSPDFVKDLGSKISENDKNEIKKQEILRISELADSFHVYNKLLLDNNYLDFGDLIIWTIHLFKQRPLILEKYRQQFKYILVDEFQDTNYSQYELIKILAQPKNNLLIVGDDDQSIFKFRGASISNIMQFKIDYPGCKEIVLKNNYRSTQEILDLSYKFIQQNNPNRLEVQLGDKISKQLKAHVEDKAVIEHLHYPTIDQEVKKTIEKIVQLFDNEKQTTWNDFAILVRANDSASLFAAELENKGIPYQFMALRGLYSKNIILDMVAYMKVLANVHDNSNLYRVLKFNLWSLEDDMISKVILEAKKRAESIFETLKKSLLLKNISEDFITKANKVVALIEKHNKIAIEKKLSELFLKIIHDIGILKELTSDMNKQKKENLEYLQQFFKKIKNFEEVETDPSLKNFLDLFDLEIQAGDTGRLNLNSDEGPEMVKILTVHSAKGLEFDYVFIVNLVDRKFPTTEKKEPIPLPNKLVKESIPIGDIHLEEERRLFYVAMTRAKKGLFFTSADDYGGVREKKLSRFLNELGYKKIEFNQKAEKKLEPQKKVNQNYKFEYQLPKKFSFTQLQAFDSCPLQYKFGFILKIPVPGSPSLSFGKSIHNTLYQFCLKADTGANKIQNDLFGSIEPQQEKQQIQFKDLLKIYDQSWINEWYADKLEKKKYYEQGKQMLKQFYDDFYKEKPNIDFLERGFNLSVKQYKIKGRIDRIDMLADNTIEIIDYKTGSSKDKLDKQAKMQLTLYQIAALEVFKQKVSKLTYYYLKDNKKISFIASDKEMDNIKIDILDSIDKIQKSDFCATPGWQCKFCDFKDICEHRQL